MEHPKVEVAHEQQQGYTAEIIGQDPSSDLALLKIEEQSLQKSNMAIAIKCKLGNGFLPLATRLIWNQP